jgi:hypothetical protein
MVRVGDQSVGIEFSEDSNSRMLFLLRSLKASIFLQAVANENLHVVGWIEQANQVDSASKFHLESWHLSAPFKENLNYESTPIDDEPKDILVRNKLKPEDFSAPDIVISEVELVSLIQK